MTQPLLYTIDVRCDLAQSSVRVSPLRVALKPGDRVFWNFIGLSQEWTPWIVFVDAAAGFLGPFESLTQGGGGLLGVSRSALQSGTFAYRVLIQKGIGIGEEAETATLTSRVARLAVREPGRGQQRLFEVKAVAPEGDSPTLEVLPIGHRFEPGDWVEWHFDLRLLQGPWRPRVSFQRYAGRETVPNLFFGPFTSLHYEIDRVLGMGYNEVPGTYFFVVTVVSTVTGEVRWVSSGDPALDSRGAVGDTGG